MLRLFNDCFAVFFLWVAIYYYQKRQWVLGTSLLSCGIGVKMSVLLSLPGIAFILLQAIGLERSITMALLVGQTQVRYEKDTITCGDYSDDIAGLVRV